MSKGLVGRFTVDRQASNDQGSFRGDKCWDESKAGRSGREGWVGAYFRQCSQGGISEEGTLVAELVLWGSREEHFRSGYSK